MLRRSASIEMQICSGAWHYLPCLLLDLASLQIAHLAVVGAVLALRHEVLEDRLDLIQTLVVDFEAVIQKEVGPTGVEGASRHANAGTGCEFVSVGTFLQFGFDLLAHAVLGENPFSVVCEDPVTLWQLVVDADVAQLLEVLVESRAQGAVLDMPCVFGVDHGVAQLHAVLSARALDCPFDFNHEDGADSVVLEVSLHHEEVRHNPLVKERDRSFHFHKHTCLRTLSIVLFADMVQELVDKLTCLLLVCVREVLPAQAFLCLVELSDEPRCLLVRQPQTLF